MPATISEETFNCELAKALMARNSRWLEPHRMFAEQRNVLVESQKKPDLIIRHPGGVPVSVETEYEPARTIEEEAKVRLGKELEIDGVMIEQAIAVCVPEDIRHMQQSALSEHIKIARLKFCVFSFNPNGKPDRWPESGWIEGDVDTLATCIELSAFSENQISKGMDMLVNGVEQAAIILQEECSESVLEKIASQLHQKNGKQTLRMAMAIVANALTFHISLKGEHEIKNLDEIRNQSKDRRLLKSDIMDVWHYIITNINYYSIFHIAYRILEHMDEKTGQKILERLAQIASQLDRLGATSQHDLCGQMFQRLIEDRKFLATFYTLPQSAALLAEIAVSRLDVDWSDEDEVASLRIGDFACGTGALLHAAYSAAMRRYRRTGGDDALIHSHMMEKVIVGTDIMPAAAHLTATVLSSMHPTRKLKKKTSIATVPYGKQPEKSGRRIALGALDLLSDEFTSDLFGTGIVRVPGVKDGDEGHEIEIPHGSFDLVIMNPPFTRPTKGNKEGVPVPSFAGLGTPAAEQKAMSKRLREIKESGHVGNGYAGLASNFIDIAHVKIKPGGILAMVVPLTILRGESWSSARNLLDNYYQDIIVVSIISIEKPTDRAFSHDTNMAEVLIIATRKKVEKQGKTNFINLRRRPNSILEAIMIATADEYRNSIYVGEKNVATCIRGSLTDAGYAGVVEASLLKSVEGLSKGQLILPRRNDSECLPLTNLGSLGVQGFVHRKIGISEHSKKNSKIPFKIVPLEGDWRSETYPALWNHDAPRESCMIVEPDTKGIVRTGLETEAIDVWEQTNSRLHFNLEFQLNAQPLAACMTPEPVLGGRAWPNFRCANLEWEIPLILWANTTLGLICFWWYGGRQQTAGRSTTTITRLPELTVIDAKVLTKEQIKQANAVYDKFKNRELNAANEAWSDETRQDLDRAVLIDLLGLSDDIMEPLALLRWQWCREPSVHGGKKTAPS